MSFINTSLVDAIIFDNNYTADEIKADFKNYPEGWDCVLTNERSLDTMTEQEQAAFQTELFNYADNNA